MKIAITGGIGCGKSTLMKLLKEQFSHIPQFSMDSLAHEALATPEVQQYCLEQFQSTNRKDIGIIIFDPKHKFDMAFLEFKIYPIIFEKLQLIFQQNDKCFIEVPLLYEKGFQNFFDKTIVVSSPEDIRIERIKKRDNRSEEQIQQIFKKQLPQHIKEQLADFLFINDNQSNNFFDVSQFIEQNMNI